MESSSNGMLPCSSYRRGTRRAQECTSGLDRTGCWSSRNLQVFARQARSGRLRGKVSVFISLVGQNSGFMLPTSLSPLHMANGVRVNHQRPTQRCFLSGCTSDSDRTAHPTGECRTRNQQTQLWRWNIAQPLVVYSSPNVRPTCRYSYQLGK